MNQDEVLGLVRHALTAFGGVLVTHGYIGSTDLETGVGLIIGLAGLVWSVVDKRVKAKNAPQAQAPSAEVVK